MKEMLQNKVIWVTGAMGLIGLASLEVFLAKGAFVFGTDIRDDKESPYIQRLRETYGGKLVLYVSDATDEQQVKESVLKLKEEFGRIDGLFHNVYTQIWKGVRDLTLQEWEAVTNGTLTSTFLVNKYAIAAMIETGGGSIVNTSSILGKVPVKNTPAAYSSAKAAVNHLTSIIAVEYAKYGIRANTIVPGDIKNVDDLQDVNNLLGRSGRPEEVAELAAFLLSDSSSYMTGSLYPIDGGFNR
ncbi:SDR family NAD(P)-dependent oxidoreductase [Paenibacillus eucommiae]|uniref:NAD(P)-dependent dehydrogenase (Short-subunit alcohol dehydrogenase family) n=1 Tax=Paenibacillus eucommiae TaxID=1355755 RepID=A0ABS4IZP4_9BACL|nr:SDR family NAD(P)-dependent oxidoreductase [Paenibacillus eucommiae]MBP1993063.1 NAD(P)-dependent dehydrogenase (short-subunit alcohol dehydrogenase family) [Paenibacillus eucommiae]